MKAFLYATLTVIALSSPIFAEDAIAPNAGFVYTADELGNSISVIDLGSGEVKTITTPISPHNVQISHDGRLLLAVGPVAAADHSEGHAHRHNEEEQGRLLIYNAETMAIEDIVDIEVGRHPAHVVIDRQGKLAYATNSEDDHVHIVDVAQRQVVGEIETGAYPHGLRISPDGREIYVANVNDDSVSVIDVAEAKEVTRIPVGKAPVQVGFTPDGHHVYVSLRDKNSVAVIDTAERKKITTVSVGRSPIQVFATPDGRYVYVANEGTRQNPDNTVSVIDTATNSVVTTIETGKGAHGVVISDNGRYAFIANTYEDTVSIIDAATHKVIQNIKVGRGPNGITFRSVKSDQFSSSKESKGGGSTAYFGWSKFIY